MACTSSEELVAFAKENGIKLTDEQLDAIAGGDDWCKCPDYEIW